MVKKIVSTIVILIACHFVYAQNAKRTAVLVDNTLSMEKQFPQVIALAKLVVEQSVAQGEVFLFDFERTIEPGYTFWRMEEGVRYEGRMTEAAVAKLRPIPPDKEVALEYLDRLSMVRGNTDLFTSIKAMADKLGPTSGDRMMVLITDGEHRMHAYSVGTTTSSTLTLEHRKKIEGQLIESIKQSGIKVYIVGLINELQAYGGYGIHLSTKEVAQGFLKKLAKATNGKVVFASNGSNREEIINKLFAAHKN